MFILKITPSEASINYVYTLVILDIHSTKVDKLVLNEANSPKQNSKLHILMGKNFSLFLYHSKL